MENIVPVIDTELLQQKANEYAQKGAESVLNDFYNGCSSPYKKALEENLKQRGFDTSFELPDVVASINDSLQKEIDAIANTAVAKTFVPLVTKFLTRAEKEIDFSDLLKKFIECSDFDHDENDWDDYSLEVVKEDGYFLRIVLNDGKDDYEIGLSNFDRYHRDENDEEPKKKRWTIYSLPFTYSSQRERTMKISLDGGATLEMPFTKGVLENKFCSYIATLVMAETRIFFDVKDFDEDMFPEREHCHC